MFDNKLLNIIFFVGAIIVLFIVIFWQETLDGMKGGISYFWSKGVTMEQMLYSDIPKVKKLIEVSERNDIYQIKISDIKIVEHASVSVTLSLHLVSGSAGNNFPELRVVVLSSNGEQLRVVKVSSSEYGHGMEVGSDMVEIQVPIRPGDSSFEITPFYKES